MRKSVWNLECIKVLKVEYSTLSSIYQSVIEPQYYYFSENLLRITLCKLSVNIVHLLKYFIIISYSRFFIHISYSSFVYFFFISLYSFSLPPSLLLLSILINVSYVWFVAARETAKNYCTISYCLCERLWKAFWCVAICQLMSNWHKVLQIFSVHFFFLAILAQSAYPRTVNGT